MSTDLGDSRHARLMAIKLHALVRAHGIEDDVVPGEFAGGAALMAGATAWVLMDGERGLGPAVAWALRREAGEVHVLAERSTGTLARRAAAFRLPVRVWFVDERTLLAAIAEPLPAAPPLPAAHAAFIPLIEAAGAQPLVEHGVLSGEVGGLEVCRVVDVAGGARLEVGIGTHDREAFQMLHGDQPSVDVLAGVVRTIAVHRQPGAPPHALNRIARERALRASLVARPALVGAHTVTPAPPPLPRSNLKDGVPCVAVAATAEGPVGLVCSTGLDLDAIPFAVDARLALALDDVRMVVPAGNDLPIQHDLAAALHHPIALVAVP